MKDRVAKLREAFAVAGKLAKAWTCPKCGGGGVVTEWRVNEPPDDTVLIEVGCVACGWKRPTSHPASFGKPTRNP